MVCVCGSGEFDCYCGFAVGDDTEEICSNGVVVCIPRTAFPTIKIESEAE